MSEPTVAADTILIPGVFGLTCLLNRYQHAVVRNVHVVSTADLIVAVVGRVDSLPASLQALGDVSDSLHEQSGSAIGRAFRKGGIDALSGIIGDCCLVIYDTLRQQLVLWCDGVGLRPLHYRIVDNTVMWCSESAPLLLRAPTAADIDEAFAADFFTNRAPVRGPFRGVDMVGGGEMLLASEGGVTRMRHWSGNPELSLVYRTDEEYEQHFRAIFDEAVRCRLPDKSSVFCELSGGLDSSSIACVAHNLLNHGVVGSRALHTISHVFQKATTSDEQDFIDTVAGRLGGNNYKLSDSEFPFFGKSARSSTTDLPTRQVMRRTLNDRVWEIMKHCSSTTLLSGIGGDQMFWSDPPSALPLADMLRLRQWRPLARGAWQWSSQLGLPLWKTLWTGAIGPLVQCRRSTYRSAVGPWFNHAFVKRTSLYERLNIRDGSRWALPSQALKWALIRATMRPFALNRYCSEGTIDVRYPFLDRRLITFAMAIPLDQQVRITESRSIVRRAMRDIVPRKVIERRTKSTPSEAFIRGLRTEWPWLAPIMARPLLGDLGLVDAPLLHRELTFAMNGLSANQTQLMSTIALELWLRQLLQGMDLGVAASAA